jgi:intracellular sulfur oxidation DsrE/DsrF family protein
MKLFDQLFVATAACVAALFLLAQPAAAQAKPPAAQAASKSKAENKGTERTHRLILQVDTNDPAIMNLALNNAANVDQYYSDLGEPVEIEIITFGPGLHMLRADTSPVKDRVKSMAESRPSVTFKACGNTQENMAKAENKKIPLLSQATVVKSGMVRIIELQEQGWSYVRP